MEAKPPRLWILLSILGLALTACGAPAPPTETVVPATPLPTLAARATTPAPTPTDTPRPTITDTPTRTPWPSNTATATYVPWPTRTRTSTPTPTSTPLPTWTPRPTWTPESTVGRWPWPGTPIPTGTPVIITDSDPSDAELWSLIAEWVLAAPEAKAVYQSFTWMGYPWMAHFEDYNPDHGREDRDLDGDGQDEIVIWADWADLDTPAFLAVLFWREGRWQVDLVVWDEYAHYDSKVYPDFSGFGRAEIVVDFLGVTGGTGLSTNVWNRSLISCTAGHCAEVWRGMMGEVSEFSDPCWLDAQQISRLAMVEGCLVRETSGLWIRISNSPYCQENGIESSLTVLPEARETFCWDDQHYTLRTREQVSLGYTIPELVDGLAHLSIYPWVWTDEIYSWWDMVEYGEYIDDLWGQPPLQPVAAARFGAPGTPSERIAGTFASDDPAICPVRIVSPTATLAETTVACTAEFTYMRWQDLSGDDTPELLIFTLVDPLQNLPCCKNQALYVFSWDTKTLKQVAVVKGRVTSPALNAVRVEDLDGDGVMEILADYLPWDLRPYFGPEPVPSFPYKVYRWDGQTYVEDEAAP
jgi:hypothetical protein